MRKEGILNPDIESAIASVGHTEYIVIGDAGLPLPDSVKKIDLSLIRGIPTFNSVLEAVAGEMVIESYIVAKEMSIQQPNSRNRVSDVLGDLPYKEITHEELKKKLTDAKAIIRTGETTAYSNIILIAGVNF